MRPEAESPDARAGAGRGSAGALAGSASGLGSELRSATGVDRPPIRPRATVAAESSRRADRPAPAGSGLAVLRSRRSSSKTASSPWPWMNCIA